MKVLIKLRPRFFTGLFALAVIIAACSPAEPPDELAVQEELEGESAEQEQPTEPPPTLEPEDTPIPPTETPEPVEEVVEPTEQAETPTVEPEDTPTPEPIEYYEIIPIGSMADFTVSNDIAGIEGQVEVISENQIRISDFVSLVAAAPGVDIRLGIDGDYSDEVAVVLTDITGKTYEGRSLTLTIPDKAFDGQTYNGIAVMCFDTAEIFDKVDFTSS